MHFIQILEGRKKRKEAEMSSRSPESSAGAGPGDSGASAAAAATAASKEAEANRQRQSNLQRIQQRKQAVRMWPQDKKLEKLAIYSSCKALGGSPDPCRCNGTL